jgi:hypothetical protein
MSDYRMINECGAVAGMRTGRRNYIPGENPPMPFSLSQISYDLTWDQTCAIAVGN